MTDLPGLVLEGLGLAVTVVLPLLLAGVLGSLVAGWLAARIGLSDPVAAGVLRGLAVLGALAFVVGDWAETAQTMTADTWSRLSAVGTTER
ncbi:MAG: hypothetical protein AAF799_43505 [Myxococcota bacterium]